MTEEDLLRIEADLAIELPASYRAAMRSFPVPAFAGSADSALWDDASLLIRYNAELRGGAPGGVTPWPPHMFALGHGGDGCPVAIDLRRPEGPVWWVDHAHLDGPGTGLTHPSFTAWLDQYVADLRADAAADDVDPDGTPEARRRVEARNAGQGCLALVLAIAVGTLVVVGVWLAIEAWH